MLICIAVSQVKILSEGSFDGYDLSYSQNTESSEQNIVDADRERPDEEERLRKEEAAATVALGIEKVGSQQYDH